MDKALKFLLNTLRCPLCCGQIDMFDYRTVQPLKKFDYACAANYVHYRANIATPDYAPPSLNEDFVVLFDNKHKYEISQLYGLKMTYLSIHEVDIEGNIKSPFPKCLDFKKLLFNFSKTNREKVLHRIKTILVFQ